MQPAIEAVIFDLDGVITDTAEYHYQAWKRLADEEGLPFNRQDNEKLRGVSRRQSLALLLGKRTVDEAEAQALMARKNRYYRRLLSRITAADLLPGVEALLAELRNLGVKIAIASASRNAPEVVARLELGGRIDVLIDGGNVSRPKPAPDLFLEAARRLGVPPAGCLVVEDAAAGVQAAHAAGMPVVGLGPAARVGPADLVLPDLDHATFADLCRAITWRVSEVTFEPARQHHRETVFTQGNGNLSTRGTLEERFPGDRQATLVHGLWDDAPLVFTELANAPDWTHLELRANGQRFHMDLEGISDYARYLDLRTGVLHRRLTWELPDGSARLELRFERFASLADPHLLALRLRVDVLEGAADLTVRAYLNGHMENNGLLHWQQVDQGAAEEGAELVVRTRKTDKTLALAATLKAFAGDTALRPQGLECPGCPGQTVITSLESGEGLVVDKFVALHTWREASDPLAVARRRVAEAAQAGYAALRAANDTAWADFWDASDVQIEGDDEAQRALRHALFQLRIAAPADDEHASIGARTLSGFGYRGHVFWDTEIFVLPFFTYTRPALARNLLAYRWHTLPGARRKAAAGGYPGAQFAWESAESGDEVTPTWVPDQRKPGALVRIWTGDIEIHITADVAYALHQYWQVTGDEQFWREMGAPILLETAVFWGARVEQEGDAYTLRDVIGPDEYHEHVDNNAYTNAMVRWHLQRALEALEWLQTHDPHRAATLIEELDLNPARLAHWRQVIEKIVILQDPHTGLIEQFEGFFDLQPVDWPAFAGRTQSMQALLGIEGANRHQVIKQPDVIMLLCLLREQVDQKTWRVNWETYHPITDHSYGSSLGPAMHAWVACELGDPALGYEHFMRAACADLEDVRGNAGDGIHAASAGGLWQAAVFGFGGLRLTPSGPVASPRLPAHWRRLTFKVTYRGERRAFDLRPG